MNTLLDARAWAVVILGALMCLTFLLALILTQRHYRAIERLRYNDRLKAKDLEIAALTERQVNGRTADDVIGMAKAIERQAKAEDKMATAVERRILAQGNVKELSPDEPFDHKEAARGRAESP
jgi:hypothetical protein